MHVDGSNALVCSLGREGADLAAWLVRGGATVTMCDTRTDSQLAAAHAEAPPGVRHVVTGRPYPDPQPFDLVGVSQSVLVSDPVVMRARALGIPVTSPMRLFLHLCPAKVIGVTGSNGKSTTTALVGAVAKQERIDHVVGGNIGAGLLDLLERLTPESTAVLEISHTQLQYTDRSPGIAAVTNVTANHLDQFDWSGYRALKQNILRWQDADGIAVLNADDPVSRELIPSARGRVATCSLSAGIEGDGAWLDGDRISMRAGGTTTEVAGITDLQLPGRHNLANALMATAIASVAGWSVESIGVALRRFTGLPHRLEVLGTTNGVTWVDDSIATTPERAVAGLGAFDVPVVLLLGGRDKGLPMDDLRHTASRRCRAVICFGEAGGTFVGALTAAVPDVRQVPTLEDATTVAATVAQPGDVVLLSPAGTSFDAYADFQARGHAFRQAVTGLTP